MLRTALFALCAPLVYSLEVPLSFGVEFEYLFPEWTLNLDETQRVASAELAMLKVQRTPTRCAHEGRVRQQAIIAQEHSCNYQHTRRGFRYGSQGATTKPIRQLILGKWHQISPLEWGSRWFPRF